MLYGWILNVSWGLVRLIVTRKFFVVLIILLDYNHRVGAKVMINDRKYVVFVSRIINELPITFINEHKIIFIIINRFRLKCYANARKF